ILLIMSDIDFHKSRLRRFQNNANNSEELRRRRSQVSIDLRKQKKDEQLMKRRNCNSTRLDSENIPPISTNLISSSTNLQKENESKSSGDNGLNLLTLRKDMESGEKIKIYEATMKIRKILSSEQNPPIDEVIENGFVPILVKLLSYPMEGRVTNIPFEAAWAITNIASGTSRQTQQVVNCGAVPQLVRLLSSNYLHLCEQCIWALGNIAGDGSRLRDKVTECNAIDPILKLFHKRNDLNSSFVRNITWTLSNLVRNKHPCCSLETADKLIPIFHNLIVDENSINEKELLVDACWALSYITDGSEQHIDVVIKHGVITSLVQLLSCESYNLVTPAVRAIGNIVTGNDAQTQKVVEANALPALSILLKVDKNTLQKETAWTISNITAGTESQIDAVLKTDIIGKVIDLMCTAEFRIQREAAWVITNIISGGTIFQIQQLLQANVLPPLINLLKSKDSKFIKVVLDSIRNLFRIAAENDDQENLVTLLEELDIIDKLNDILQSNFGEDVTAATESLLNLFHDGTENPEMSDLLNEEQFDFKVDSTTLNL
ncbi:hypothetical protein SNEBB_008687, partial [Seison nebaliae]